MEVSTEVEEEAAETLETTVEVESADQKVISVPAQWFEWQTVAVDLCTHACTQR